MGNQSTSTKISLEIKISKMKLTSGALLLALAAFEAGVCDAINSGISMPLNAASKVPTTSLLGRNPGWSLDIRGGATCKSTSSLGQLLIGDKSNES